MLQLLSLVNSADVQNGLAATCSRCGKHNKNWSTWRVHTCTKAKLRKMLYSGLLIYFGNDFLYEVTAEILYIAI